MLDRVRPEAVAAARPALRPAEREHPGVLARAVVLDRGRFRPALELVLLGRRLGEQAADGGELLGRGEVRRRGDRDLLGRQVVARPHERQRLERLRRGAEEGDALGIARLLDHRAVAHGDRVHDVRRLDDAAAADDHLDRVHGRQPTRPRADQSSHNTFEQHRLPRPSSATKEERTWSNDLSRERSSRQPPQASSRSPLLARTGSHCGDQAGVPQPQQQPVREAARVRHARGRACSPGRVPGDRDRERRQPRRRDLRVRRERRLRGQEARGRRLGRRARPVRLHGRAAGPAAHADGRHARRPAA